MSSALSLSLLALALLSVLVQAERIADAALVDKPIIGVLTLPSDATHSRNLSFFPASYVKFVEAGGGRVVPIRFDDDVSNIVALLDSVNGVLFTGGAATLQPDHPYFDTIRLIVKYVRTSNEKGDFFPLWGTCLGFESILVAIGDYTILSHFDAVNFAAPLQFLPQVNISRIFSAESREVEMLSSASLTFNYHEFGVSPEDFAKHHRVASLLRPLATSVDKSGRTFIAAFEGISMPIYGVQFHPEKVLWEMNDVESIPHSSAARNANQYFGNFFIDEARKSSPLRRFPTKLAEQNALIYNYSPTYTGKRRGSMYEQIFYFGASSPPMTTSCALILRRKLANAQRDECLRTGSVSTR